MTATVIVEDVTPILAVDDMEACLSFWRELGFSTLVTVPEAPPHGFAIVAQSSAQVMLQTRESLAEDLPAVADRLRTSLIYLHVAALEPVLAAVEASRIVVPRRTTFYGADEVFVAEPAGHVIGFSAPAK